MDKKFKILLKACLVMSIFSINTDALKADKCLIKQGTKCTCTCKTTYGTTKTASKAGDFCQGGEACSSWCLSSGCFEFGSGTRVSAATVE